MSVSVSVIIVCHIYYNPVGLLFLNNHAQGGVKSELSRNWLERTRAMPPDTAYVASKEPLPTKMTILLKLFDDYKTYI